MKTTKRNRLVASAVIVAALYGVTGCGDASESTESASSSGRLNPAAGDLKEQETEEGQEGQEGQQTPTETESAQPNAEEAAPAEGANPPDPAPPAPEPTKVVQPNSGQAVDKADIANKLAEGAVSGGNVKIVGIAAQGSGVTYEYQLTFTGNGTDSSKPAIPLSGRTSSSANPAISEAIIVTSSAIYMSGGGQDMWVKQPYNDQQAAPAGPLDPRELGKLLKTADAFTKVKDDLYAFEVKSGNLVGNVAVDENFKVKTLVLESGRQQGRFNYQWGAAKVSPPPPNKVANP